jgi:hypothetical protein
MWLHILKKDLRLHWPYLAAVWALKIASVWMILRMGIFAQPLQLMLPHALLDLAFAGVAAFTIVVVVQSDPIVSTNDDWLIRPIRRRDLALEKVAFAALVILLPTFVFDLGVGLVHGLNVLPAIGAAAYTSLFAFISFGLPALAVGTITANWHQAAGIVFAILISWVVCIMISDGGIADVAGWPLKFVIQIIFVIATVVVLTLQYGRRKTTMSRGVFAVAAMCAFAILFMPRLAAYQSQLVADDSKVARTGPIRLAFDDKPRMKLIGKTSQPMLPVIFVPLKVTVDPDRIVTINNIDISIAGDDGKPLYRNTISIFSGYPPQRVSNVLGDTFDVASNGHKTNFQAVDFPADVFSKLKNTPGRLSLTYHLSAYAPATTIKASLPLGTPQKVPGFGVCAKRLNPIDDQVVELYCFPATDSPNCIAATVLDLAGASIGTPETRCSTTSTQWSPNTKALTDPGQLVLALPAATGAGILPLSLTTYKVASHFTQTVALPQVRLADLTASAGP